MTVGQQAKSNECDHSVILFKKYLTILQSHCEVVAV